MYKLRGKKAAMEWNIEYFKFPSFRGRSDIYERTYIGIFVVFQCSKKECKPDKGHKSNLMYNCVVCTYVVVPTVQHDQRGTH